MKTVLITGASGGLGLEFAKLFAQKGHNLLLVARSTDKLNELKVLLEHKFKVTIDCLTLDLSKADGAYTLQNFILEKSYQIEILINNAGFGDFGVFPETDEKKMLDMMYLNMNTLTHLSYLISQQMKQQGTGKILNVASTAAFLPLPRFSVYAATKSYVLSLSMALYAELKPFGIQVSVLCPGPTHTGFQEAANMQSSKLFRYGVMSAEDVSQFAFRKFMKGKILIIPGLMNKASAFFPRIAPRKALVTLAGSIMK